MEAKKYYAVNGWVVMLCFTWLLCFFKNRYRFVIKFPKFKYSLRESGKTWSLLDIKVEHFHWVPFSNQNS